MGMKGSWNHQKVVLPSPNRVLRERLVLQSLVRVEICDVSSVCFSLIIHVGLRHKYFCLLFLLVQRWCFWLVVFVGFSLIFSFFPFLPYEAVRLVGVTAMRALNQLISNNLFKLFDLL